ncbi:MAG: hypothetical protein WC461_02010 [Candidatus Paceibacterota bacterium]
MAKKFLVEISILKGTPNSLQFEISVGENSEEKDIVGKEEEEHDREQQDDRIWFSRIEPLRKAVFEGGKW